MFMNITCANYHALDLVESITKETIEAIYPHYYPKGAVDFFLSYHNRESIIQDIRADIVYLLYDNDQAAGTVTIHQNEINRLFVLPSFQGKGYGRQLLEFAENQIAAHYDTIHLAASLPAKNIYIRRGYKETESHSISTENGDYLYYDVMERNIVNSPCAINYEGKCFVSKSNTDNGEVNDQTRFFYHQKGNMIWAEYAGGQILKGYLIGTVDDHSNLTFSYQHINDDLQLRIGSCHSTPTILTDGRLELHETWQWQNGDKTTGQSVLVETTSK